MIIFWWGEGRLTPFWTVTLLPAQSLQSCPALCGPMDHSPPGSSVCAILQLSTKTIKTHLPVSTPKKWKRTSTKSLGGKSLSSMIHNSQKVIRIISLGECIQKTQYYLDNRTLLNNGKNKRWAHTSQHGWTSKTEWKRVRCKSPPTDCALSFIWRV